VCVCVCVVAGGDALTHPCPPRRAQVDTADDAAQTSFGEAGLRATRLPFTPPGATKWLDYEPRHIIKVVSPDSTSRL
jgi:hypothetical protein